MKKLIQSILIIVLLFCGVSCDEQRVQAEKMPKTPKYKVSLYCPADKSPLVWYSDCAYLGSQSQQCRFTDSKTGKHVEICGTILIEEQ